MACSDMRQRCRAPFFSWPPEPHVAHCVGYARTRARAAIHFFVFEFTYACRRAGAAAFGAVQTRIRFPELLVLMTLHTVAAATALSLGDERDSTAMNIMCTILISLVATYSAYASERGMRTTLVLQHRLARARVAVARSGMCVRARRARRVSVLSAAISALVILLVVTRSCTREYF